MFPALLGESTGKDLSRILEGGEYGPDEVNVRLVKGDDGKQEVPLRVDLGVLQMEMAGPTPPAAHC